jgi:hypothetical protein
VAHRPEFNAFAGFLGHGTPFAASMLMHRTALPLGLLAGLIFTTTAWADCAAPPPVVWSYPADGATGVPTDADFLVLGTASSVEIDGRVIERTPTDYAIDLGELEPSTEYTLQIGEGVGADVAPEPITFTTGSGAGVVELPKPDAATCQAIFSWQGCFDTGAPDVVEIEVDYAGEEPLYVLYSEDVGVWRPVTLWPRGCGETIRYQTYDDHDYMVKVLGYNGVSYETENIVTKGEPEESAGCSLGRAAQQSGSSGWLLVFAIGTGFLARRRRVRA